MGGSGKMTSTPPSGCFSTKRTRRPSLSRREPQELSFVGHPGDGHSRPAGGAPGRRGSLGDPSVDAVGAPSCLSLSAPQQPLPLQMARSRVSRAEGDMRCGKPLAPGFQGRRLCSVDRQPQRHLCSARTGTGLLRCSLPFAFL